MSIKRGENMKLKGLSGAFFKFENKKNPVKYSIYHSEYPIKLTEEMQRVVEQLLWYVPNIDSIQSPRNDLALSLDFDDFAFSIVQKMMNLRDEDVAFLDFIPESVVDFYQDEIEPNEQKILMTLYKEESKINSLLRHIRNAIAHGYFTIVEGLLVGFDFKNTHYAHEECTAIFKIHPKNLLKALRVLNTEVTEERLAKEALLKCGYVVEDFDDSYDNTNIDFDFYAKSKNFRYAIDVKKYNEHKTLPQSEIDRLVSNFSNIYKKIIPVLFVNTSLITDESKKKLQSERIIILDVKNIKKMMRGIDILKEVTKLGHQ